MKWKNFFKPTKNKVLFLLFFFAASIFFGFFKMSGCFINDNGVEMCRKCGIEGIFNPFLRPVSFFLANIPQVLFGGGNIQVCGAEFSILFYWPLDIIYQYFISCLIVYFYKKNKR